MPTEIIYATSVYSSSWTNPTNALGAADSSCVTWRVQNSDESIFGFGNVTGYSESEIASIDSVKVAYKFQADSDYADTNFILNANDPTYGSLDPSAMCAGHIWTEATANVVSNPACAGTTWHEATCTHYTWTAADMLSGSLGLQSNANNDSHIDAYRITFEFTLVTPNAPADPTISANAVGGVQTSSGNPTIGSPFTNVEHQVSTSSTFASGITTWTKGSAPSNPQTNNFTSLGDGTLLYARARYANNTDWGDYNTSPYNSATTWNVPGISGSVYITNETVSSITFGWDEPADNGSTILEYHYQWKIDGGSFAIVDTNSVSRTATKSTLDYGTKYWFEVRAVNTVGEGAWTEEISHYTLCATPTVNSVLATDVSQLTVDWASNDITGSRTTNAWDLEYSVDGTSGWTHLQYFDIGTTSSIRTTANGDTSYYRIALYNFEDELSEYSTDSVGGTTWNYPDSVAPIVADYTIADSMLQLRRGADPYDGGGTPSTPINTWTLWRSSTFNGTFNNISGDISIGVTSYDDWTVNGGETWYYKCKFTNLVGESILSTNYTGNTALTPEIDATLSDTTVQIIEEVTFPLVHEPISQWDFNTIDTYTDKIGSNHLSLSAGTVSYNNSGGWNGEGYVSFDGTSPDSRIYTETATYTGATENGSVCLIYFIKSTWRIGQDRYGSIGTNNNNDYIMSGASGTPDSIIEHKIIWNQDLTVTETVFSAIKSYDWLVHAYGYDGSTNEVFMWVNETEIREDASAGTWGWNIANGIIQLGGADGTLSNDPHTVSHARLYVGLVPDITDIQFFKTNGEFIGTDRGSNNSDSKIFQFASNHPFTGTLGVDYFGHLDYLSDTRIKIPGNNILIISNAAIKRYGFDTISITDDIQGYTERIKVIDNEIVHDPLGIQEPITSDKAVYQPAWNPIHPLTGILGIDYFGHIDHFSNSTIKIENQFEVLHNQIPGEASSTGDPITTDTQITKVGEISRVANTTIYRIGLETITISNSAIYRKGYNSIDVINNTNIKNTFELLETSLSKIVTQFTYSRTTDSIIFRASYNNILLSSDARVVQEGTYVNSRNTDTRILDDSNEVSSILADTLIVWGQELSYISDTAIFIAEYAIINATSDTAVYRSGYIDKQTLSDTAVYRSGLEVAKLNDTRILRPAGYLYPFQRQLIDTDTVVQNASQKDIQGFSRIKSQDSEFIKTSDSFIILNLLNSMTSDTTMKITDTRKLAYSYSRIIGVQQSILLSDTVIKIYGTDSPVISDVFIYRTPSSNIMSDSTVLVLYEMSGKSSDTLVINKGVTINKNSDSIIFNASYGDITKRSLVVIKYLDNNIICTADARVLIASVTNVLSDASIRRDRSNITAIFQKGRQL